MQLQKNRSDWVALLAELALVINTTTTRALPQKKTLFDVWFGRKPHWITAKLVEHIEDDNEVDSETSVDELETNDDNDEVLNEIETRVTAYNIKLHVQMIKANNGRSAIFTDRTIATLQIPPKLRLATEPPRLPVRILERKNGQYKL